MSESIELSEYNPKWPGMFEAEKYFLESMLDQWIEGSIEHVGSTAVEGLVAKPIIDVMVGVRSLEGSKLAVDVLVEHGYCYYPYKADVMHWFCKPSPDFRTHHLHLVPYKSALWHERICFRDALRADSYLLDQYAVLKKDLAKRYGDDREAYTLNKWPFIKSVLEQAGEGQLLR